MTPEEVKRWLPRPQGPIREFFSQFGEHDTSLEQAIGRDVTHDGFLQFLADGNSLSNYLYRIDGQPYHQYVAEVRDSNPLAAYRPIGNSECIVFSTGMRFLIGRVAHLTTLLTVKGDDSSLVDSRELLNLFAIRDYGMSKSDKFDDYDLIRLPWELEQFKFHFDQQSANIYIFLCKCLTFFVLEHERQHALSGHLRGQMTNNTSNYIGEIESRISSFDAFRILCWLFEAGADWHAAMAVLRRIGDRSAPLLIPNPPLAQNILAMQGIFLASVTIFMKMLYEDAMIKYESHEISLNREHSNVGPMVQVFPLSQEAIEVIVHLKPRRESFLKARKKISNTHPHCYYRMLNSLCCLATSGAPMLLGENHDLIGVTNIARQVLTKLSEISYQYNTSIDFRYNFTTDFAKMVSYRERIFAEHQKYFDMAEIAADQKRFGYTPRA